MILQFYLLMAGPKVPVFVSRLKDLFITMFTKIDYDSVQGQVVKKGSIIIYFAFLFDLYMFFTF